MQEIHQKISNAEELSDRAKLILLMTTFIPCGRYATYAAIREWTALSLPASHIAAPLRKATSGSDLEEIPIHRILEKNGGIGCYGCDWGNHMPGVQDDEREELLKREGIRFDKNGRLLGGGFQFMEVEEMMRGTAVEEYIKLPYRFGGWH
ncbi:hypothetical protein BDW02DRAFT_494884 [Decorospora gaudefroyi]|uniref:Uncharacterized protein n=1 Tax=Decorospora gaudefroyi TaxID=184978 RepID=A0A6A5KKS1_9PLEO|nr:hypothetical protein BDW02DRAFT_494884 [Decorospora gaudefroyi]